MSDIHLIPDKTAIIQLGIFLAVLVGLSYCVFKPIVKLFNLRKDQTDNLIKDAQTINDQIKLMAERYSNEIKGAQETAAAEREKLRTAAFAEEQLIKKRAISDSLEIIENARQTIRKEKEAALKELEKQIPLFAEEIINRLKV